MRLAFAVDFAPDDPVRARDALAADFRDFFRAGGVLRVEDWLAMNEIGRAAAVAAGDATGADRAAVLVDSLIATTSAVLREVRAASAVRGAADAAAADAAEGRTR